MRVDKLTRRQRRLRARMRPAEPIVRRVTIRRDVVAGWLVVAVIAIIGCSTWASGGWDAVNHEISRSWPHLVMLLLAVIGARFFPDGPKSGPNEQVWWYDAPDGAACAVIGRVMDSGHPDVDFWEVEELLQTAHSTHGADLLRQICADADVRGMHLIVRRGVRFIPGDRLSWDAGALAGLGFREGERWIVRDPRPRPAARSVAVEQRP